MFTRGFEKIAEMTEEDKSSLKKGALIGAGAGASKNILHDAYLNYRERSVKNTKSYNSFIRSLKKGDILLAGSTPKNSGKITVADLPDRVAKAMKSLGAKNSTTLLTNSSLLNTVGAGQKYHGAIYLGNGQIAHMTTDKGIRREHIREGLKGQNVAAYRLKKGKGTKAQAESAVNFAKKSIKKKVQYEKPMEYLKEPLVNLAVPDIARRACRDTKNGLVCHTLPVMAYDKQKFVQGRRTFSGDIRKNLNFEPVARRDVVNLGPGLKIRGTLGNIGKGLKYAIPGAAIAYGMHKYKNQKEDKPATKLEAIRKPRYKADGTQAETDEE